MLGEIKQKNAFIQQSLLHSGNSKNNKEKEKELEKYKWKQN